MRVPRHGLLVVWLALLWAACSGVTTAAPGRPNQELACHALVWSPSTPEGGLEAEVLDLGRLLGRRRHHGERRKQQHGEQTAKQRARARHGKQGAIGVPNGDEELGNGDLGLGSDVVARGLVEQGRISGAIAKAVFAKMFATGRGADAIVASACVQMPSLASIPLIEAQSGLPVVSSAACTTDCEYWPSG